jgi:imidazolonepropionase
MPALRNIGTLARCLPGGLQDEIHLLSGAAVAWTGRTITWVGPDHALPAEPAAGPVIDARGQLVIPGLVDCHTHLAFGGWRGDEFAQRIRGHTYQEIAAAGGGIASTMRKTRGATTGELVRRCRGFLAEMAALGVTTVECKTGYGLDEESELRLLEVYGQLAREGPHRIVPTLLAAHVVPP